MSNNTSNKPVRTSKYFKHTSSTTSIPLTRTPKIFTPESISLSPSSTSLSPSSNSSLSSQEEQASSSSIPAQVFQSNTSSKSRRDIVSCSNDEPFMISRQHNLFMNHLPKHSSSLVNTSIGVASSSKDVGKNVSSLSHNRQVISENGSQIRRAVSSGHQSSSMNSHQGKNNEIRSHRPLKINSHTSLNNHNTFQNATLDTTANISLFPPSLNIFSQNQSSKKKPAQSNNLLKRNQGAVIEEVMDDQASTDDDCVILEIADRTSRTSLEKLPKKRKSITQETLQVPSSRKSSPNNEQSEFSKKDLAEISEKTKITFEEEQEIIFNELLDEEVNEDLPEFKGGISDILKRGNSELNDSDTNEIKERLTETRKFYEVKENTTSHLQKMIDDCNEGELLTPAQFKGRRNIVKVSTPNRLNLKTHLITNTMVFKNDISSATKKYKKSTQIHWCKYLSEKLNEDPNFNGGDWQNSIPASLEIILQYMLDIRGTEGKSFNTTSGYGYQLLYRYLLSNYDTMTHVDRANAFKIMQKFVRGLARIFGVNINKVPTLLNRDRDIMLDKCDVFDETGARDKALIAQACGRGLRGDTFEQCLLLDILFKRVLVKQGSNTYLVINTHLSLKKDKWIKKDRIQVLTGHKDPCRCPNYALLWYLCHHRKVFKCEDVMEMIKNPTNDTLWEYKPSSTNEQLFTKSNGQKLTSKNMSSILVNMSKRCFNDNKNKMFGMRSCRSGLTVMFLMRFRYTDIPQGQWYNYMQRIADYIGWKHVEMVHVYDREISSIYDTLSALRETDGEFYHRQIMNAALQSEGFELTPVERDSWDHVLCHKDLTLQYILNVKKNISTKDLNKLSRVILPPHIRLYIAHEMNVEKETLKEFAKTKADNTKFHGRIMDKAIKEFTTKTIPQEISNELMNHPAYLLAETSQKKTSVLYALQKRYLIKTISVDFVTEFFLGKGFAIDKTTASRAWKLIPKEVEITNKKTGQVDKISNDIYVRNFESNTIYQQYVQILMKKKRTVIERAEREFVERMKKGKEIMMLKIRNNDLDELTLNDFGIHEERENEDLMNDDDDDSVSDQESIYEDHSDNEKENGDNGDLVYDEE